jgi:GNAT superfamily N-acetyltransferase
VKCYAEDGASIDVGEFAFEGWIIERISVRPTLRGQGIASRLLDRVCADADAEGVVLTLLVQPEGGRRSMTYGELMRWYARRGFVCVRGDESLMRRKPGRRRRTRESRDTDGASRGR